MISVNSLAAIETPGPFKIDRIHMADAGNFHFRVMRNTTDGTWLCNNGPKNPELKGAGIKGGTHWSNDHSDKLDSKYFQYIPSNT